MKLTYYAHFGHSFLTRNWSRCRSDSGVNSVDMGMISLLLMIIALHTNTGKPLNTSKF